MWVSSASAAPGSGGSALSAGWMKRWQTDLVGDASEGAGGQSRQEGQNGQRSGEGMLPGEMGTAWGVRDEVAAWGNGGQQRCDSRALNAKPRSPKNMRKPGPVLFLPPPPRHPSPPPPPQETLALFPPFVASGRLTAARPLPAHQGYSVSQLRSWKKLLETILLCKQMSSPLGGPSRPGLPAQRGLGAKQGAR